jgi:acyl transferase domain-containing protein
MTQIRIMRPLPDIMAAVADELSELVRLGDELERLVARLAAVSDPCDAVLLHQVQAVDLLVQRLSGAAVFVRALAIAAPQTVSIDVLEAIRDLTLTDQAQRLAGVPSEAAGQACGDVMLFED